MSADVSDEARPEIGGVRPGGVEQVAPGGGEMIQRVRSFDWSRTSLGPKASWPAHLRTAVDICLHTRVPLMVVWGREGIQIYNDALAPVMGDKHPGALGRPYAESFAEIWDYQGPRFRAVLDSGRSTYDEDQEVCFWRNGVLEEMYYTFSWSPIFNPGGGVDGAFHPATETTNHVITARRLTALRTHAAGTVEARTPEHACRLAAAALQAHRKDVPFALFYLLDQEGTHAKLVSSMGLDAAAGSLEPVEIGSAQDVWDFAGVLSDGPAVIDVSQRHGVLVRDAPWPEPCRQAMVLPLTGDDSGEPLGVLVAGITPRRPLDGDYVTWLELLKSQLDRALATAQSHGRDRNIAITLQRSLFPGTLPPVEGVDLQARYQLALEYTEVGGDWYDAICVDEDNLVLVVGDVMGHGVQAATTMGRLRSAAQAYALLGLSPAEILHELNGFAVWLEDVQFATVLCARYSPSTGGFVHARAGHLAPLLLSEDGSARLVDEGLTVPLAVADELWAEEHDLALAPGEAVVLYTDGLVERRGEDIDRGLDRLLDLGARHRGDLSTLLDAAMKQVSGPDSNDDLAVLALRRNG